MTYFTPTYLFEIKNIVPNGSSKWQFYEDCERIDYICKIHPNEIGSIIILKKSEAKMSNTESLKLLERLFDIKTPEFQHKKNLSRFLE